MSQATPPIARRRNHGRGHSYEIEGERVDGVTWAVDNGIPKPALIDWAARTTAEYAVDRWDELADETPSKRLRVLERARWDAPKKAAARGTDVHKLALRLAAGEEVDVPEPLVGHVDAYLKFVDEWQPREILVEVPVFHRTLRYAGTLDLIADLIDGNRWLLDWKTSASGIFRETAVQLAAYRNAEFFLDADGREQPLPEVDFCGAVWLRADGYDLHPVAADDHAFRLFQYARAVALFNQDDKQDWVEESLAAPRVTA
jgi:hypothetical protein